MFMTCSSPGLLLKLGQEETPMVFDKGKFTLEKTTPLSLADEELEGSSPLSAQAYLASV
jgi:hypothetical protein